MHSENAQGVILKVMLSPRRLMALEAMSDAAALKMGTVLIRDCPPSVPEPAPIF